MLIASIVSAQSITWSEITSNYSLPSGIKLYEGVKNSTQAKIYYLDVDMNNSNLAIRPYISTTSMTLPAFTSKVGAYAAINGGFFGGSTAYSTVIYPNEIKAANVSTLTRNSLSYPVIRSLFSMKKNRTFGVNWVYHFGNALTDIYDFTQPLNYGSNDPTPKQTPLKSEGKLIDNILTGIGGAPTLVKNGIANITYNQEIMWGSGVEYNFSQRRTAVGYTSQRHVILLADEGATLPELATIMISLGCVEAMNLDGGGSTQMAISNKSISYSERPVPAILAVVHSDSLNLPKIPLFEKVIDTADTNATAVGGGWFETANPGYWGSTKSLLHPIGNGTTYCEFRLHLPKEALYNVYGWWVSSSNRSTDTPFIIKRKGGTDTIKVDQTANGSSWKLIGNFRFAGTLADKVIISDAAKTNNYIVADAIKIDSYDPVLTDIKDISAELPHYFSLDQNYPNPFNPSTNITYKIMSEQFVTIKIYDVLGKEVAILANEMKKPGSYKINYSAKNLVSGIYIYRLTAGNYTESKKMVLLR